MQHTDLVPKFQSEIREWPGGVELEVVSGTNAGERFELFLTKNGRTTDRLLGGRGTSCEIALTDTSVSEVHFSLRFSGGTVRLSDEHSRNGTWLGLARLEPGSSVQLFEGAEFRAANTTMRLAAITTCRVEVSPSKGPGGLRGRSEAMLDVFSKVRRVAPTPLSVLIWGETGVGKGEVARAIHTESKRSQGPFHRLDCGALRELAEATLYGHAKGAFTGATGDKSGVFEAAEGGTLFLDEIGELSTALQKSLLTALGERVVTRLGETAARPIDVRIVAATNRDLRADVESGRFRRDLYHRLREFELTVPPLRERPDDIVALSEHFIAQISAVEGRSWYLADDAKAKLTRLQWAGNARELKNVVKRATYLSPQLVIRAQDLFLYGDQQEQGLLSEGRCSMGAPDTSVPLRDYVAAVSTRYCKLLMEESANSVETAAKAAGYSGQGFKDMLTRLGLAYLYESQ